jgi:phosphatidylserine/phosphatidylglycerophosphate/cardiolipin synthase-like enzyme
MTGRDARWLLDLADFFGGVGGQAAATLQRLAVLNRWPINAAGIAGVGFDATSWLALRDHLEAGGVVAADGTIDQGRSQTVAAYVETLCDAVAVAVARLPEPTSRLVITATASEDLAAVRTALRVPSLYELIERTIRSATATITLGAPYWNDAALTALTPAIEGALDRGCILHIIVQAGQLRPSTALDRIAAWAAGLRAAHGPATVWHFDADDLSDRHIQLHAKFVLADDASGYLGSANLTDKGFEINFEIGAALGAAEVHQLHALLDELRSTGILTAY